MTRTRVRQGRRPDHNSVHYGAHSVTFMRKDIDTYVHTMLRKE